MRLAVEAKSAVALNVIRVAKTYEVLAEQLREQILTGAIPPGAPLPNERDLGDRTGLGRGSVREALRVLEAQGLISTRLGRNGGRVTRRAGIEGISQSLEFFVRSQQIEFISLIETIEVLEPALAALAARHRTDRDIYALKEASKELKVALGDPARVVKANTAWHLAVATASHNPVLVAIKQSIGSMLHDPHIDNFVSLRVCEAVLKAHDGVERAIIAGDVDAARRRMGRHIRAYRTLVVPVAPKTITVS
jgi:GntR family transcriptional regulator, transcriptional repressor for pyruvate dehydrogenase complex